MKYLNPILRDQAEKSLESAGLTIRGESNTANDFKQTNVDNEETRGFLHGRMSPTYTIAGVQELYQQLLLTKVYNYNRKPESQVTDEKCRLLRGFPGECAAHSIWL